MKAGILTHEHKNIQPDDRNPTGTGLPRSFHYSDCRRWNHNCRLHLAWYGSMDCRSHYGIFILQRVQTFSVIERKYFISEFVFTQNSFWNPVLLNLHSSEDQWNLVHREKHDLNENHNWHTKSRFSPFQVRNPVSQRFLIYPMLGKSWAIRNRNHILHPIRIMHSRRQHSSKFPLLDAYNISQWKPFLSPFPAIHDKHLVIGRIATLRQFLSLFPSQVLLVFR